MISKAIDIQVEGYWRYVNRQGIPTLSGIYFVYECANNKYNNSINLLKLLYVGESQNVHGRIQNHEEQQNWLRFVKSGNELCFSVGKVEPKDRERVEAAIIFTHKPICNKEYKNTFPYDFSSIILSGGNRFLKKEFTIEKSE